MTTPQIETLEALRATAEIGTPPFVSLVRQAVDEFIARELSKPGVKERVADYYKERPRVVNLHEVRKEK